MMENIIGIAQDVSIQDNQWALDFNKHIMCKIQENDIAMLYDDKADCKRLKSLIGIAILMEIKAMNEDEVIEGINQDSSYRTALGLPMSEEEPIDIEDLVDLLMKLNSHYKETGIDLIKAELERIGFAPGNDMDTDEQNKRVINLMQLSSKLVEAVPQNNDTFLWELLELALKNIPEADYGSISIIEGDAWRYAAAKGHNWELLKSIPLKPQYSLKYDITERKLSTNVYIMENIVQADTAMMPEEIHRRLVEASMPIKQSLMAEICFNGKCKGHISLDIAEKSPKNFQDTSKHIIKGIGDMASAYLMMRESYSMVDNLENIIRLSGKLVFSAVNKDESFLSELLKIALEQIKEADYGTVSVVDGDVWRFVDAKGHDIKSLRNIPLTKNNIVDFNKASKNNDISSVNIEVLENFNDFSIINLDSDTLKCLEAAMKKSKQILLAQFNYKGDIAGYIAVEIAASSYKSFSTDSERVIEAFGNIASAYVAFQRLSEMQQQLQVQTQQKLVEAEHWNKRLEQTVNSRTIAVRNLLDNVGQGLLTFGCDIRIKKDYSLECSRIFGEKIENKMFTHLIYPDDQAEAEFIVQVLREVFHGKDRSKVNVYLSMLPNEIRLGNRFIALEYKLIDDAYSADEKVIMVILTEITEKKLLEHKLKEDERIIRMVANVAANFSNFMDCVKEFQYFYGSKLHEILDSNRSVSEMFSDIYRDIHTFKGSFGQFEMYDSVENLNSMESALSYVGSMINNFSQWDLRAFVYSFDIIDFLEDDMSILKNKLGNQFLSTGETVAVDKFRLSDIEREIMEICSPVECRTLLPMVKSLRFKSLKDLLGTYPEYTVKLAERLEKPINVFAIEGEDVYVDGEKYGNFIKSLVHVFRNSVDHGFEAPNASLEQQDYKIGNISCHIGAANRYIEIVIADDGIGLDFDKIRNKAIEYGLYSEEQALLLDEEVLLELIFRENFSTKDSVTDVSGRGMGLSAVKLEVEKLGGELRVHTKKGEGTRISFKIPLMDAEQIEHLSAEVFAEPILNTTIDFLQEHFQSQLEVSSIAPFNSSSFNMKNYTGFISIKGLFDGSFAISMDNDIAASLLHRILLDYIEPQAEVRYTKDVIAECTNMIIGNSIKSYPNIQELIIIGTPNVIYSSSGDISYDGNMITGYSLETNKGNVIISIIQ